jgi:D-3-phosphoglycerate dehydrogenase
MCMTWQILLTDGLAQEGRDVLQDHAELIEATPAEEMGAVDAAIIRSRTILGKTEIERGVPRLKVIGRAGVGVDNIDLQAAKDHQVVVVNAPEATTIAVAEHTMALMLALARQLPAADASTRAGKWEKSVFTGDELNGKLLGLIGLGRIGSAVAERARAFGMQVLAFDPFLTSDSIKDAGAEPSKLEPLLMRADIVSVHVPHTPDTHHLLGSDQLEIMKTGSWLISTSRGGVIDEEALLEALETGRVGRAALDVFAQEPPHGSALLEQANTIFTPHIGGQTHGAQARVAREIASEVLAALRGEPLRWRVV